MKKQQYIFLILITIILYLQYLIIDYKYKEYKINNHIDIKKNKIDIMDKNIKDSKEKLEYISSRAYKNKILKEEGSRKNKGEIVIFITNEDKYNKFSKQDFDNNISEVKQEKKIQDGMSIFEKWLYFLLKKDIR